MNHDPNCIFCKIVAGQIPSRKAYEDDDLLVFHDIAPWAPVHLLLIPKEHVPTMYELEDRHAPLLGRMRARNAPGHPGEFDIVVAMLHDHGLIPVKYLGVEQGVNVTLGLPFVRTSPDHGTAFDIASQGIADHASLDRKSVV